MKTVHRHQKINTLKEETIILVLYKTEYGLSDPQKYPLYTFPLSRHRVEKTMKVYLKVLIAILFNCSTALAVMSEYKRKKEKSEVIQIGDMFVHTMPLHL